LPGHRYFATKALRKLSAFEPSWQKINFTAFLYNFFNTLFTKSINLQVLLMFVPNKSSMKQPFKIIMAIMIPALILQCSQKAKEAKPASGNYVWKSVQMAGGGFVDGIIFHPKEKGLRYARTDMGGAYRWSEEENRWLPITDWVSYKDRNLMGIESIALDPNDPDKVYLACGTYTSDSNCAIFRSIDRGKTFERTNVPIRFGGNQNGRGNGERMMVDPNDGNIIYLGTRRQGLWRSMDKGVTWDSVAAFPDVTPKDGSSGGDLNVGVVVFFLDKQSGGHGKSRKNIF
jgi:hypothetical protein